MNWIYASLIAGALSCAYMLDGPSEQESAQDVAADSGCVFQSRGVTT